MKIRFKISYSILDTKNVCCIIKMDKVANKNTHFCKGNIPRIAKAIESKIKPRYPIR